MAALERDEFILYYQPVVSADPEKPISFEALLRWNHPSRGLIAPGAFDQIFGHEPFLARLHRPLPVSGRCTLINFALADFVVHSSKSRS